ncbi:Low molecular weight phosphotyrosine protein phosphatase [Entomophthora muscae]|uniref:Low molecular weight phosphotyrosine protein phosphatase n=1 Tax=Entomophthora muscae TaxID=34485 RepID=A0ACC2TL36_9FUNG|nr:Low molecular weight phosphotyrosine protein phosphatase [Entomophthora muscae]
MAEAVFSHIVKEKNLSENFYIDSAATSDYHIGDTPDQRSVAKCNEHGVSVNHRGRQVTKSDFNKFDYIFCMDESNLRDLNSIKPDKCKATGNFSFLR